MANPERMAKPEAWWGAVLSSVREKASTAELWDAIRTETARLGIQPPANMFQEVNRLRSLAAGLRVASERLADAPSSEAITGRLIGQQIYARDAYRQGAAPEYHIRFQLTTRGPEGEATEWRTMFYQGDLSSWTVGELEDAITDYATGRAEHYEQEFVGVGGIEIGAY